MSARHFLALALTVTLLSVFPRDARADDWPTPEPVGFHGRGFEYVAEIFPPKSRQNASDQPICFLYTVDYPGTMWAVKPRLLWKRALVNKEMPYEAVLSMDGRLVTLDDYANIGYTNQPFQGAFPAA